jgi:hypothetical protein
MPRAWQRHGPLEASLRLHTHGALARARWRGLVARRHPSATKAATRFRNRRASAPCNCAKLRARLRPSVRFTAAVDTRPRRVHDQHPASVPVTRQDGLRLAASQVPAAPHQAGTIEAAFAVWLQPCWMPSLQATAPVSAPIRHGGARDGALAVCQRHSKIGLLLADSSDPVADLEFDPSSGTSSAGWSPRQESLRGPRLAEVVRAVPEGPARGSSWHQSRHRSFEPRRGTRAGGGRGRGRKSPFFQNRVQGTSGRNSSRPQIGIEHPGSVHFRGSRPGFLLTSREK